MFLPHARFAIYFAPRPETPLARFGNAWLGTDPETGASLHRPDIPGLNANECRDITAIPARYGFHATLKAPFRLAPSVAPGHLQHAVRALAQGLPPVRISSFEVSTLGGFLVLRPTRTPTLLNDLAYHCVVDLDRLRARTDIDGRSWRRRCGLVRRHRHLMTDWGYPYVFDQYRFHITLTAPLALATRNRIMPILSAAANTALGPHIIEDIALFGEPALNRPFQLLARYPLLGPRPIG